MQIIIKAPGLTIGDSLKDFILEKAQRLEKLHDRIVSTEVTLAKEDRKTGPTYVCEINMSLPGKDEFVKANSPGFEEAVVQAVEMALQKLRTRKTQRLEQRRPEME